MLDSVVSDAQVAGAESVPATPKTQVTGIAILGSNPVTLEAAPFGDQNWKIWACSPDNSPHGHSKHAKALPRVDEWFEVHHPFEDPTRPYSYLRWLEDQDFACVWLRDEKVVKRFKTGRLYPERELKGTSTLQEIQVPSGAFQQVKNKQGQVGFAPIMEKRVTEVPNSDGLFCPYMFTSSIAFMLAKAIVDCEQKGIRQIGLWGIMQAAKNEWTYQKPGIQYFLHQAMSRNIKVVANRESCLFDMPDWKW